VQNYRQGVIAVVAILAIAAHLALWGSGRGESEFWGFPINDWPLLLALFTGGTVLVVELLIKLFKAEFGSDLLAGISIVTSILLGEYLAGTIVVLMLSGGEALEAYAVRRASLVLELLAKRMPSVAHRKSDGKTTDIAIDDIGIGDALVIFPHEVCPVDGVVTQGRGTMDESYLTGEPYVIEKTPGSEVLSGAINGHATLTIEATKRPVDSRFAKIMQVMRESEQRRPRMRRLADQLGAFYTPLAVAIALVAWAMSGSPTRFLAVLVVATPCPLLIAIPVAIIGAISLAARRSIIIKDPVVLERISECRTAIFDKTGTLTYGEPHVTSIDPAPGFARAEVLLWAASLERFSKHPLSEAILDAAREDNIELIEPSAISERPGEGLRGTLAGKQLEITSRKKWLAHRPQDELLLPEHIGGLECLLIVDNQYAARFGFRDEPRREGSEFVHHLKPKHAFTRVLLVSGDRESEVRYLAEKVGITEVYASQSPEQKVEIVRRETQQAPTIFMGDGINDAPALTAATVGIAFGQSSDVTTEAAGVVVLDSSLSRVDELLHIGQRMRRIALQSAFGGMALSILGMGLAAFGYLPPVAGAVTQEVIDVLAVLNALRVAWVPRKLTDF
jgi:heavy metal translocating P-type ATPase